MKIFFSWDWSAAVLKSIGFIKDKCTICNSTLYLNACHFLRTLACSPVCRDILYDTIIDMHSAPQVLLHIMLCIFYLYVHVTATRQCTGWCPWPTVPPPGCLVCTATLLRLQRCLWRCTGIVLVPIPHCVGQAIRCMSWYWSSRLSPLCCWGSHETPPFHNCNWMVECSVHVTWTGEHSVCV